jgi:hypothetical protein
MRRVLWGLLLLGLVLGKWDSVDLDALLQQEERAEALEALSSTQATLLRQAAAFPASSEMTTVLVELRDPRFVQGAFEGWKDLLDAVGLDAQLLPDQQGAASILVLCKSKKAAAALGQFFLGERHVTHVDWDNQRHFKDGRVEAGTKEEL